MNPKEHKKNIQKINYILIKQKNKTMNQNQGIKQRKIEVMVIKQKKDDKLQNMICG